MDVLRTNLWMGIVGLLLIGCNPFEESQQTPSPPTESTVSIPEEKPPEPSQDPLREAPPEGYLEEEAITLFLPNGLIVSMSAEGSSQQTWNIQPPETQAHLFQSEWQITGDALQLTLQPGWNYIATIPETHSSLLEWLKGSNLKDSATVILQKSHEQWFAWGSELAHRRDQDGSLYDGNSSGQELDTGSLSEIQVGQGFWVYLFDSPSAVDVHLSAPLLTTPPLEGDGLAQDILVRLGVEQALDTREVGGAVLREYTPNESSTNGQNTQQIRTSLQELARLLEVDATPNQATPNQTTPTNRRRGRTNHSFAKTQTGVVLDKLKPLTASRNSRLQRQTTNPHSFESFGPQRTQHTARELQTTLESLETLPPNQQREVIHQWIDKLTPPSMENYHPQPVGRVVRQLAPVVSDESLFKK